MTYFGFLLLFLIPPLCILIGITIWDVRTGHQLPQRLRAWSPFKVLFAHVIVAVLYTTPWDNYLVATRVWWYDPELVTGIVFGWVPLEEYTFFVLQTMLTGLWVLVIARRISFDDQETTSHMPADLIRRRAVLTVGAIWIASLILLISGQPSTTYLSLELSWALVPVLLQLAVGADILWQYRQLVTLALVPTTLYLCIGDAIAIGSGTWTIDPLQSTGLMVGNLPIEEILFFFLTNLLVISGMILVLAYESQTRVPGWLLSLLGRKRVPNSPLESNRYETLAR